MVDWTAHANWIPATRVKVDPGDPHAIGATFTAWTGYGPLTLEDRMRVKELTFDRATGTGRCVVEKLGPVLTGTAGFTVEPDGSRTRLEWFEDVDVKYLPRFAAPAVDRLSALGFAQGMKRLAKSLAA